MAERHSEYERDEHDWYVEPASIVRDLLRGYPSLHNGMHDPCCGGGTIPETATAMGFDATGADLVDRANGRYRVMDFFEGYRDLSVNCYEPTVQDRTPNHPPRAYAGSVWRYRRGSLSG